MRVKLKDITKFSKGTQINGKNLIDDGAYSYLNGGINPSGKWNEFNVAENTVTISEGGNSSGYVNYMNEAFWCGAHCYYLYDGPKNSKYLYYALKSQQERLFRIRSGACMPNIKKSDLGNFIIEYEKDEVRQEEVVKVLEKCELLIEDYNKKLTLLDEAVRARFVEMFGDPNIEFKYSSVKFNDLVARMTKGPFGSDMKKDLFVPKGENTYKVYIQINAIQKNQSLGEYYISKEYFDRKVSRFELFPNDYIITCDGTLGKYLKLDENMEKGVISPSLLRLTLQNDKINDKYFENIWDFYMLGLMKKEARNACLVHLPSAKKIGELSIPVPPLELQNQFASFVEEIDKSRLLSNHSLFLTKSIIF